MISSILCRFRKQKRAPLSGARRNAVVSFLIRTITVGTGITPVRGLAPFADCTAGGDFHSAPKNIRLRILYAPSRAAVKHFLKSRIQKYYNKLNYQYFYYSIDKSHRMVYNDIIKSFPSYIFGNFREKCMKKIVSKKKTRFFTIVLLCLLTLAAVILPATSAYAEAKAIHP